MERFGERDKLISEEIITASVLDWLKKHEWSIISYDFPQSGTGYIIHPDYSNNKNKGLIIPDIVALKRNIGILFENKDRFYLPDFKKLKYLKSTRDYDQGLLKLFRYKLPETIFFGVAITNHDRQVKKAIPYLDLIDFLVTVSPNREVNYIHLPQKLKELFM